MKAIREVVIVSAARTPIGSFNGVFNNFAATKLGAVAINEAIERSGIDPALIEEVIMGNVLPANLGQAPARQAAISAGLDKSVTCMTINKVCGSGLKSVMLAAQAIMVGDADVIVAGGMENMTMAPYYMDGLRNGVKMGNTTLIDGMIKDGLWDVYNDFHMGIAAELCASECSISREDQDGYAQLSYERALAAQQKGYFKDEIVKVEVPQRKKDPLIVEMDEEPQKVNFDKFTSLKPAFKKDGTVTAANASSINDGAAAVLVMSMQKAKELNLKPLARIVGQSSAAKAPEYFTTAPTDSINKVLHKTGLTTDDIDLFEINEAFAVVSLINNRLLKLQDDKVNVNGGAVALGHPIGASGTRILTTLLYAMQQRNVHKGLASLCIGGGEASSIIVEKM
ncbi:MAG: acetyl-CoA C-acyltransferase [Caldithrix sp.]|nr:acetyl-CoA C-acyltransferase [Caldithrix sp.]